MVKQSKTFILMADYMSAVGRALTGLGLQAGSVPNMRPDEMVDMGARIRSAKQLIENLDKLMSDFIQADIPAGERSLGINFLAIHQVTQKTVLDTERVKVFLGTNLPKYQKPQVVHCILYRPKV